MSYFLISDASRGFSVSAKYFVCNLLLICNITTMIEANKYKLGIFVLTGIGLLIVALFMLGLSEALQSKINFITYFDESVQGLDIGSPVKFRGVTIGKVIKIAIRPKDNFIRVDMQAMPSSIQPSERGKKPVDFFNNLQIEVRKGLRCRLELKGITGMKYVEMDYLDPKKIKKKPYDPFLCPVDIVVNGVKKRTLPLIPPEKTPYIPSSPSLMSGLRSSLSVALARIASIDFKKMSAEISGTLKEARELLGDSKINNLIEKVDKMADNLESVTKNINRTLTKERLEAIVREFHETLKSVSRLSKTAEKQINDAKVPDTTKAIRDLKQDLAATVVKLNTTLDAISELAQAIEEDPSSILRGKQAPEKF